MKASPLDKFGQLLMENLRDRGLKHFDLLAEGSWRAPSLQNLQRELAGFDGGQREVVRRCVVSALDHAIHDFLFKLQERADLEGDVQIVVDGQKLAGLSDGLQGEPYGSEGWQRRFSKYGAEPDEA